MISEDRIVPYEASDLPVKKGPWLVFAPHPDDESFGMGGTIARATDKGIQVNLAVMTDGALGGAHEDLVAVRKKEAIAAAELLGLERPVFLDYRDRELELNDGTLKQVKDLIEKTRLAAVFFPGVFELHPDHRTTAALVWRALRELKQPELIPVSYEVLVQSPANTLVDITSTVDRKRAAMAVYQSQLAEHNYVDITLALNTLRTLTLSSASYAEAFFRFEPRDVARELEEVISGRISSLFET